MFDEVFLDYDEAHHYGSESESGIGQLLKALQAQEGITDIADLRGVGALQPQSLDMTVKSLVPKMSDLTLWKNVPKGGARSTLEEYTVENAYGQEVSWSQQMETPLEGDPDWERRFARIKFIRALWKYSDVASMVQTIDGVEIRSKNASIMRLLRKVNETLYNGDDVMIPEQIPGFEAIISSNGSSDHVIDLRGTPPTQNTFRNGTQLISDNFGNADAGIYMSSGGVTVISQILGLIGAGSAQRYSQFQDPRNASIGHKTKDIITDFGELQIMRDLFIGGAYESRQPPRRKNASGKLVEGRTSQRAPEMPAVGIAVNAPSVTDSLWSDAGVRPSDASTSIYKFRIAAGNRWGLSQASAEVAAPNTVLENGALTITITPAPNSQFAATYYEIYSTETPSPSSPRYRFMKRVKDSGAATTVFQDLNRNIPGTTKMFILDFSSTGEREAYMLKQLAPVHAVEFARIGMYRWGVINYYCASLPYAPLRLVMIDNIPVGIESTSELLNI